MPRSTTELADLDPDVLANPVAEHPVAEHPVSDVPGCTGCAHSVEVHDSIALRYCAATLSSALSRGCICQLALLVG